MGNGGCRGIAPSMGSGFGPAGSGFIRLNLGCPRTYLEMAIDGLKRISVKTIKEYQQADEFFGR
ncbi:aminotransferase [Salmonella enterica subsp. enterica]|uniref:Aminotransferase n=1 Tax=Salmonella enterica I TaxID=59201 RepID=A0A379UQB3_SALET|nr:aminotransferase [Salmonella enterica subsp. enterica]